MIEGVGFSSKSEVLYLGVRKKKIVNPNLKKTLDIPKGVVVLTTIGFNIRIKGFDILVKSIQSLMDSNRLKNDIIVLVIGISENSEDSNSLRQLIAEAGLNRKIMSLGIRNDINDILNISDIYLQPSRTEGLSLSIMEALTIRCLLLVHELGAFLKSYMREKTDIFLKKRMLKSFLTGLRYLLIIVKSEK